MNELDSQTVVSAAALITDLLPDGEGPGFMPQVTIVPTRLGPAGIGGVVGVLDDPNGDIRVHRLEGSANVVVKASTPELLHDGTSALTDSVLATDRIALRSQGIYRLQTQSIGPVRELGTSPPTTRYERDVELGIIYEHRVEPVDSGGIISEIPQLVSLRPPLETYVTVADIDLRFDALSRFTVVDDSAATTNAPSDWQFNPTTRRTEQLRGIRGTGFTAEPVKPGTYLVLNDDTPPVSELALIVRCRSGSQRALGAVFRWQDSDNFYFFLMSNSTSFAMLAKKSAGVFAALDTVALNTDFSMDVDRTHTITIDASGSVLRAYVGSSLVVSGDDSSISGPGSVGLMSYGNPQANFYRMTLARPP